MHPFVLSSAGMAAQNSHVAILECWLGSSKCKNAEEESAILIWPQIESAKPSRINQNKSRMLPTNQSIRLIALPLSKQSKSLIYFYAQPPPPQTTSDVPKPAQLRSPSFLIKKLTDTGTKQWIKLADSKQGS
ncbi:hypothetical protein H4Q26_007741 [Puccinia striiformis f. sp. tritici PST-130]|nr:hypothetical protein H4Q26_007741 [Puccinia striiformis f. sp. tritici PST-130]